VHWAANERHSARNILKLSLIGSSYRISRKGSKVRFSKEKVMFHTLTRIVNNTDCIAAKTTLLEDGFFSQQSDERSLKVKEVSSKENQDQKLKRRKSIKASN
jgi:hypothetical protein